MRRRIEERIAIRSENEGHVADTFAVRYGLCIQRDVDGCRVIMVLKKLIPSGRQNFSVSLGWGPTYIDDPALWVTKARFPHMSKRKIVLALPTPIRVLLLVLEVLLILSLRVRGSDEVRERARGVVRVSRTGQLDAHPTAHDLARLADRYPMMHGEEVPRNAGPLRSREVIAGEEERDERAQVAEGV
jgi:hypothetical protein